MARLVAFDRARIELKAILSREWYGAAHRTIVVDNVSLWDGVTGSRRNGARGQVEMAAEWARSIARATN